MAAWHKFAKLHLNKLQNVRNNFLFTEKAEVEIYAPNAQHRAWPSQTHHISTNSSYQLWRDDVSLFCSNKT